MDFKETIKRAGLKYSGGRKYLVNREIKRIDSKYFTEKEVQEGIQHPDKKNELVAEYFKKYPDRFKKDRDTAFRLIKEVPAKIGSGTDEELYSELMFYRLAYGFHPEEYVCYEFAKRSLNEQTEFISARECFSNTLRMNDAKSVEIFDNKGYTYEKFRSYYHREAVYIEKEEDVNKFRSFVKKHPIFVKKAVHEAMGKSVELLNTEDMNPGDIFEGLMHGGPYLLEERIIQSPVMDALNSTSINTVRCITFFTKHGVVSPYFFIKIGRKGSFIDNGGAGGILVGIDASTGQLCTDGYDECNREFKAHPDSGILFIGYQLPQWAQMKDLCIEMSNQIPEVKFIGWDLAHTNNGWVLVEGNGHSQMIGPQTTLKKGMKAEIENYMINMEI